jgi:inner membrane protein
MTQNANFGLFTSPSTLNPELRTAMDILTHTLSGAAAASAIAAFSSRSLKGKFLIIFFGAAGAMLPDLDAVTRWPGFDAVIGKTLGLSQTGRSIYFGQHWYSHHNFMHSLAAAAIFTLAAALIGYIYCRLRSRCRSASAFIPGASGFLLSFLFGYVMHLLGDLPTPDTVWNGIRLFWPLTTPVGGFGYIWWWNNYDIFLIFLASGTLNTVLIAANRFIKKRLLNPVPTVIFLCMICATLFQVTHRPTSFASAGNPANHADKEHQSLAAQRDILGKRLYGIMNALDRKIPIPF